jgi:SAM-dependent methyltransferase
MSRVILDIGCGQKKALNSIGVDLKKTKVADIIADVCHLPFKDESVDEVLSFQVLEHVDNLVKAMEELYRVLKIGGKVKISVPHVKGLDAFRDPTHRNFFTIASMDYFTDASGYSYYSKAKFRIVCRRIIFTRCGFGWIGKFFNLRPEFTEHFLIGYFKPHICWVLEKGERK